MGGPTNERLFRWSRIPTVLFGEEGEDAPSSGAIEALSKGGTILSIRVGRGKKNPEGGAEERAGRLKHQSVERESPPQKRKGLDVEAFNQDFDVAPGQGSQTKSEV